MRIAAFAAGLVLPTIGSALLPLPAAAACIERVVVFEMQGCPHCANTRAFLEKNGVPFERIDIWQNPEAKAFMIRNFGSPGVPVTTNGTKAMRGHSDEGLRKLLCLG